MEANQLQAIYAALVKDNRVLILKIEDKKGDRWTFPGGPYDPKEYPIDALRTLIADQLSGTKVDRSTLFHQFSSKGSITKKVSGQIKTETAIILNHIHLVTPEDIYGAVSYCQPPYKGMLWASTEDIASVQQSLEAPAKVTIDLLVKQNML